MQKVLMLLLNKLLIQKINTPGRGMVLEMSKKERGEKVGVMLEEQETHINFSRGDERAKIYTSDATTMTKLNKLVEGQGTEWKLEEVVKSQSGEVVGKIYSCPVSFVSFRKKRVQRNLSEEQRREIAFRLRNSTSIRNFGTKKG